jgi:uncharacterized repeat protein (TIGR01451 family)
MRLARIGIVLLAWLWALSPVVAQASPGLSVTPLDGDTLTPADLAQILTGPGVTVDPETVSYKDPNALDAAGTFSEDTDIVGLDDGVLLTTGDVDNVVGPNDSDSASAVNEASGDADLDALAGGSTEDATVLEFAFVPVDSTVTFRYVFGSEEYNEFVYTQYNDVFGFFVNGINCATVPDTTTPVTINTINGGSPFGNENASNPLLYRNNDLQDGGGAIDTELDGLTTVMTCTAPVEPDVSNHIKLAIADVGDSGYDSAVFLEGGSFSSGVTHQLTVTTSGDGDGLVTSLPEGITCDTTAEIPDCSEAYDANTVVTLTASPYEGSTFVGWTGCDEILESGDCSVTMSEDKTVNAQFDVVGETSADLSVSKSDAAPGGPDPVSSGGLVAYTVSVGNAGPDDATGVTVVDTATNGTVQSASGTGWTCGAPSEGAITCSLTGTLDAETTASPITVLVKAPSNPGAANATMTDTASVSGDQTDPNGENDSDSEDTTVTGAGSAAARDHASTFFDGQTTTTLQTTRDTAGRFYSKLIIPGNSGLGAGPVSIDEVNASLPQVDGFCGGRDCDAQVQITVLPPGQTPANNPIQVFWFYVKDSKQGSTVYVKGDNESVASVVRNCLVQGIANPGKCVNGKTILSNGDRQFLQLWRDGGDPGGGKR